MTMTISKHAFSMDELLSILGGFEDDYDIPGIIAEATEVDPETGERFWTTGALSSDDLWEICERHDRTLTREQAVERAGEEIAAAFAAFQERLGEDIRDDESDDDVEYDELLARLHEYDLDDDECEVEEWTEWCVLAGEQERIEDPDFTPDPVWAWIPTGHAEVPGEGRAYRDRETAAEIFATIDPMGQWMARRIREAKAGDEPAIHRRFEVDLVCQTVRRYRGGFEAVADESVRLSKGFDLDDDDLVRRAVSRMTSLIGLLSPYESRSELPRL